MCDAFHRVVLTVRPIVHRVDLPLVACAMMGGSWMMRYMTGSRILMFGCAMSILARRTREPSGNSPFFMRSSKSIFSSTDGHGRENFCQAR